MEEALSLRRSIGARFGIAASLGSLADVARCRQDWPLARELYQASIRERQQLGIMEGLADCLLGFADVLLAEGQPHHAARLLGVSEAVRESLGQTIPPVDRPAYDQTIAAVRASLPSDEFDRQRAAGRSMTAEQAIERVLSGGSGEPPNSQ
jgi:hypothetical protein